MKISVCMGIYNGEKYIEEQLYCIMRQTVQPDEVILCDDCSRDGTVQIVKEFIVRNHLQERWKLLQNQENMGNPGNYYHVMSLCTGDVVFLADQDDIWCNKKVERLVGILKRYPEVNCVCCKFGLVDKAGSEVHAIMGPAKVHGEGRVYKITVEQLFYKCEWSGMVLAYRNGWYRQWFDELQRRTDAWKQIPHDFLISARAAEEYTFYQLDEKLAYLRRHDSNGDVEAYRLSRRLNKRRKMQEISDYLHFLQAFAEGEVLHTREGREALMEKLQSMQARYGALKSGRIGKVLGNAWKNRKNVRLATAICDEVIVKGKD